MFRLSNSHSIVITNSLEKYLKGISLVIFMEKTLNELDIKVLAFCNEHPKSVGELSKLLNIAPSSVTAKIKKLKEAGLIEATPFERGKKTRIKTIKKGLHKQYILQILDKIKKSGGHISFNEFATTPELFFGCKDFLEKSQANTSVLYSNLIERRIYLTQEGEAFLKQNEKTKI